MTWSAIVTADSLSVAEQIRSALLRSAVAAYEDAAMQGLCCEGAWEAALSAMRRLDLTLPLDRAAAPPKD